MRRFQDDAPDSGRGVGRRNDLVRHTVRTAARDAGESALVLYIVHVRVECPEVCYMERRIESAGSPGCPRDAEESECKEQRQNNFLSVAPAILRRPARRAPKRGNCLICRPNATHARTPSPKTGNTRGDHDRVSDRSHGGACVDTGVHDGSATAHIDGDVDSRSEQTSTQGSDICTSFTYPFC